MAFAARRTEINNGAWVIYIMMANTSKVIRESQIKSNTRNERDIIRVN